MTSPDTRLHVEVKTIAALSRWLSKNHHTTDSVWLVTYKKASPHHIPWGDVVAELIAWGWIDSSVRGIDDLRFKHLISPRKPTSAWSKVNKDLVKRLRAEGRMHPSGEAKIAAAQKNGMWTFLDDVERLVVPDDLAAALGPNRSGFDTLSRSVKRGLLEQLKRAKTQPTRQKRIAACVEAAKSQG